MECFFAKPQRHVSVCFPWDFKLNSLAVSLVSNTNPPLVEVSVLYAQLSLPVLCQFAVQK